MVEIDFEGEPITLLHLEELILATKIDTDVTLTNVGATSFFDLLKSFYAGVVQVPAAIENVVRDEVELKPGQIVRIDGRTVKIEKIKHSPTNPAYILSHE